MVDNYPLTLEAHQNYFLEIKAGCPPMSLKTHLRPFNQMVLSFQNCVLSLFLALTIKGSVIDSFTVSRNVKKKKIHAFFSGCLTRSTYLSFHAVIWACQEFTMQPSWVTNSWSFCPSNTIPITFNLSLESSLPSTHLNNPVTCIYSQGHFTFLPVPRNTTSSSLYSNCKYFYHSTYTVKCKVFTEKQVGCFHFTTLEIKALKNIRKYVQIF